MDQPLQPFSAPVSLLPYLEGFLSPGTIVAWFLYAAFAIWSIYTIIAVYHWIKYSHASLIALPAIGLHLFVSFVIAVYALSGVFFI